MLLGLTMAWDIASRHRFSFTFWLGHPSETFLGFLSPSLAVPFEGSVTDYF